MCQSTNDVIPSAVKMACCLHLQALLMSMGTLENTLKHKTQEFTDVVSGTNLLDMS